MRLFTGISAPEEWKTALAKLREKLEPRFSTRFGRWTALQNIHLTLRFFGSVEETDVLQICERSEMAIASLKAFCLSPGILGCFPNPSRPRIVWLGLRGDTQTLVRLEALVRAETANFGQAPENRPFHPHLTIIRVNEPSRQDREVLAQLIRDSTTIEAPEWQIKDVELIRSELKPGGSVYTTLAKIPLAGQ